jgi:hypothetical protein
MEATNHYTCLRKYLKRGYRKEISRITGASISLINLVLRGDAEDTKGIIPEAYRIANEIKSQIIQREKELEIEKEKFSAA